MIGRCLSKMADEQTHQQNDEVELTEDNLKEIDESFTMLDTNKSGYIEFEELHALFSLLNQNPTEEMIQKIINTADEYSGRKDGKLDKEEFIQLMKSEYGQIRTKEEEEAEILQAFQVFDKNGDGYITDQELQKVLSCTGKVTLQEAREMVDMCDTDKDGRISYQEFVTKMLDS